MELNSKAFKTLNNGLKMPIIGLGTWKITDPEEVRVAVHTALQTGYRLIDTAKIYKNEKFIGEAIRTSGVPREEIFVTSKVWMSDMSYRRTLAAFDESLKKLELDYLDLYLMHWPVPILRKNCWRALQELYKSGRCRAIGVANHTGRHLEELLADTEIIPTVNQVEFHPFLYQKDLQEFCGKNNIQLEAYSPLTHAYRLDDAKVGEIAKKYGRTNAQIMLRWNLQLGNIVIPKSVHPERIRENFSVFDFTLSGEDMTFLNALNENKHFIWDPNTM